MKQQGSYTQRVSHVKTQPVEPAQNKLPPQSGRRSIKAKPPVHKSKTSASKAIKQGVRNVKGAQRIPAAAQKTAKAAQQITQRMQVVTKKLRRKASGQLHIQ